MNLKTYYILGVKYNIRQTLNNNNNNLFIYKVQNYKRYFYALSIKVNKDATSNVPAFNDEPFLGQVI